MILTGRMKVFEKLRAKADAIRNSGGKLHYFGKAGLSEDEKSILSQVSAGIGCGTKAIALILAITAMNLSWQLFIGLAGTQYNSFEPYSFFQNESASTLYVIFCLSVFVALGVARLVYALIMMLARKKSVDHLASEQESWLRDLQSEKRDLQNKLERLKRELAEARSQAL
jgi:DNA-binding CsgD family transcriptional regulator